MKTTIGLLIAIVLGLSVLTMQPIDAADVPNTTSADAPVVVCTTSVLSSFVEAIAGDLVNVTTLVQPGVCPGHFDIKPSDVSAVSMASLVLYHGFEPWLQNLITASGNDDVNVVTVSGPWNTPAFGLSYAKRVADALMATFPEWNATFAENNATLTDNIQSTAEDILDEIAPLSPENYNVTCMEWQVAFVKWLGFNIAVSYPSEESLSTADTLRITEASRGNSCALVIDNLQSGSEFGAQLAQEIGAVHVVLSNFPDAVPGTHDYCSLLTYNAEQMIYGLNTYLNQRGQISELQDALRTAQDLNMALGATTIFLVTVVVVEAVLLHKRRQ